MTTRFVVLATGLLLAATLGTANGVPARRMAASTTEPITLYAARAGDTLEGLAARYMTSPRGAAIVQRLSGVADPFRMPVGIALRIPNRLLKSAPTTLIVLSVTGPVTRASAAGAVATLAKGDEVREGDRVSTGANAFATLAQADGTRVTLPSHTTLRAAILRRVVLGSTARSDLVVESGRSEMTVTPLRRPADRFEIRTPAAVAAVRGTQFRVAYDPSKSLSTLEVMRGRVAEAAPAGTSPRDIGAGEAAQRPLGGERRILPLPDAPALNPPDPTQEPPRLVLRIANPRPGWSYRFVLARDEAFNEVLAEITSSRGVARFDATPPETLSAKITAIDENGIEGFAKTYTILRLTAPRLPHFGE